MVMKKYGAIPLSMHVSKEKGKKKVQGVPKSQAAAHPESKRKRKQTKPKNRRSNKRATSPKIRSLFPKRGNHNAKRTEQHKNKIIQDKI